jgi:hypothetical protein
MTIETAKAIIKLAQHSGVTVSITPIDGKKIKLNFTPNWVISSMTLEGNEAVSIQSYMKALTKVEEKVQS